MKTHRTLSIEVEVWNKFQQHYPNQASKKINEYLRHLVNLSDLNSDGVNLDLQIKKLNEETEKSSQLIASMEKRKLLISTIKTKIKETEIKKLEKEKELILNQNSCSICKVALTSQTERNYYGSKICKFCLLSGNLPEVVKNASE